MKRRHQGGYNLIELLVAIAILGVILLTVLSLFVFGRRNVYSGKQMTTAIAIGTRALEDMAALTKQDIYGGVFDIADTAAGTTIKFGYPLQTYDNAALRSTNASAVTGYADTQKQRDTGPKFLDSWSKQFQEDLAGGTTRPRLQDGAITLIMMPRHGTTTPVQFGNAAVMQLRVIVSWSENSRRRELILDSVKAQ
jgi:prepilin-type N-terminal cleavage/methylation domain-containing protein